MDVVRAVEEAADRGSGRPLPRRWRTDDRFAGLSTVDEVISVIRDCGACSDRVLGALVEFGPSDAAASVTILAALLRLRAGRCRGVPERVDALAGELAVVLGEAWRGELPTPPGRRLANVMADRAWGRVRAAERKGLWLNAVPLDAVRVERQSVARSLEDAVVTAVAVEQFRTALDGGDGAGRRGQVARAWDAAVELSDREDRTGAERNRWQYARRVLRRHVTVDLEVVDGV